MTRLISTIIFVLGTLFPILGQHYKITGKLVNSKDKPIELATVFVNQNEVWTTTNEFGEFTISTVSVGKITLVTHCLGYAKKELQLDVKSDILDLIIHLQEDNLALDEVVVTAQRKTGSLSTSYFIDRATFDHAQVLNITDITSLLPGGKTTNSNLTNDDRLLLRSEKNEKGNPSFGTAIEVDGVRLSNNSSLDETKGSSTRNVSTINIESVEVITGIPSVEYGDLTNGVVKINTRKGKTPLFIELTTKPNTKQYAASKGILLGAKAGILNTSFEHTKSNSDIASPYTTYDRNSLSLTYSTVFNKQNKKPLSLTVGLTGNIGGYNSKSDPDAFKDSYRKSRDNTLRGNLKLNWLLNQSWITNLEFFGSFSYSDKLFTVNKNNDSSSPQPAIHGKEEGYFLSTKYEDDPNAPITLSSTGYWYQLSHADSKPIDYNLKLKADWVYKYANLINKVLIGIDFKRNGNNGKGIYYDDMRYTPTWREYKYSDLPYTNNIAVYAEDKLSLPINKTSTLHLTAGLRSDITIINESEYGTVNSISPRFNAKYVLWEGAKGAIRDLSFHAGWGKAVKLPSFETLYPSPTYNDILSLSVSNSETDAIYAYKIIPGKAVYNPNLKWQYSKKIEIGIETNILGAKISLSGFWDNTFNPYISTKQYTPIAYNFTGDNNSLNNCIIPANDRTFLIDQSTGVITVSDKTGKLPNQTLNHITRETYKSNTLYTNGSTIKRRGLEWTIDFPQIKALKTSFRLDGNYYYYKGIEENTIAWMPNSTVRMKDGSLYKYVGYYPGSSQSSTSSISSISLTGFTGLTADASAVNGNLSKQLNTNLTITTHIPQIRLILSVRIESSLYNYTRNLSEYKGKTRGFVLEDIYGYSTSNTDIYGGDRTVAVYPLYYSTWEEPDVKIPFAEKYVWAKENDPDLFENLSKLVVKSSHKTTFNPDKISAYFSANLNVTKEIGNYATISFYANNFFNSLARVKSSKEDTELLLYNGNRNMIPKFSYGLTLRIKL